jgi:hypothetical protein
MNIQSPVHHLCYCIFNWNEVQGYFVLQDHTDQKMADICGISSEYKPEN